MHSLWSLFIGPKYPEDVCERIGQHIWSKDPKHVLPDHLAGSEKEWLTWRCIRCDTSVWVHVKVFENFCEGVRPVGTLLDNLAARRPQLEERLKSWSPF